MTDQGQAPLLVAPGQGLGAFLMDGDPCRRIAEGLPDHRGPQAMIEVAMVPGTKVPRDEVVSSSAYT